jgi:hypothetical protein
MLDRLQIAVQVPEDLRAHLAGNGGSVAGRSSVLIRLRGILACDRHGFRFMDSGRNEGNQGCGYDRHRSLELRMSAVGRGVELRATRLCPNCLVGTTPRALRGRSPPGKPRSCRHLRRGTRSPYLAAWECFALAADTLHGGSVLPPERMPFRPPGWCQHSLPTCAIPRWEDDGLAFLVLAVPLQHFGSASASSAWGRAARTNVP